VVRPSLRRPSSRSACATQLRIEVEVVSNSLARSSALRPARTSSTIRCRYSGAYRLCVLPIVLSPLPAQLPYCPRNRVNSTRVVSWRLAKDLGSHGALWKNAKTGPLYDRDELSKMTKRSQMIEENQR